MSFMRILTLDSISSEIIKPQFYEKLSSENQLEIIIRRIRWRNEQYLSLEALSFFQDTDVAPEKKSKVEQVKKLVKNFLQEVDATSQKCSDKTRKLFADLSHERGVANLWLNNLNEATQYFREAERIFRKLRYQYRLSRELNWFGYAHFRKGDLEEAEDILAKGIKEFLKLGRDYPEEPSIGIQNVYSNMNPALRLQGRFYEATNYGKIAASIADQRGDQRELARFLIALGETYELSNKTFEASLAYERADRILAFAPDPMLRARVLVGEALLSYRHSDYVYILEYYQRGKSREDVIQKYHEVYPSAREQLEQTKEKLESALDILTKNIRQPTRELADVYYYLAEYYTITNEWEKSVRFFKKSEELAKRLSSQYREVDAIVCQVVAYYYMEGGGDVYKNEVEAAIKRIKKSRPYSNLLGKLEIMRANFSYERYLKDGNEEDLRNAVERYVIACDHMYKYSRISRDRFYGTIRILVKRLSDLTRDQLPSPDFLESLRDIWNYDEHELKVCQKYSDKFDEIIDFTLKRLGSDHKDNALEAYAKGLEKKIQSGINDGKEALRFVPMYANMLLHLETDFGTTDDQAKAYHLLADTYAVNDNVFEVLQNNLIALEKIRETGNDLLKSKILIRLGTTSYRVGKYAKTIEHYRRADIKKNVRTFKEKNKEGVDQAISHFHEAKEILEKIWQHSEGKNERKQIASVQAHLHFRLAEHHVVTGKAFKEVADQFEQAIEKAEFGDDNWRRLDAIQSQIAYHYFSDPLEYEASDVEKLRNQFHYLNKKQYFPVLLARLEITDGNIAYDRIASDPADASVIEKAFDHYINATRYKAQYSDKHFYEAVGTLIDRIADLPQESAKILHQKVYPRLRKKIPTGLIAEDAYKLVEQFLYITGEIL
ncbi:MAG: hypothetical protein B6245_03125 [Desulfobacteraceae bacterium 4572_88]|nr:MAG: hypothetical protein B6245_03125 [Desulfobacteraceae bacterium 4572_88]